MFVTLGRANRGKTPVGPLQFYRRRFEENFAFSLSLSLSLSIWLLERNANDEIDFRVLFLAERVVHVTTIEGEKGGILSWIFFKIASRNNISELKVERTESSGNERKRQWIGATREKRVKAFLC